VKIRLFRHGWILLTGLLLVIVSLPAQAQQLLTYGTGATGTLSNDAPVVLYTFQGNTNDTITLQVLTLSGEMQPAISLNSVTGSQVATSNSDASNPLANSARLTTTLPETGIYTVIVTSASGSAGQYAIRLDGIALSQQPETVPGTPGQTEIAPGRSGIRYTVPADPENLLLATLSVDQAGTLFSVAVTAPNGQSQGLLSGNGDAPVVMALPPATDAYTLDVLVNAAELSVLSLNITQAGATPDDAVTPLPTAVTGPVDPTPDTTEEVPAPEPTFTPVSETSATSTVVQQVAPTATPVSATATTVQQASPTYTPSATPSASATTAQQATATATATQQASPTYTPSYTPTTPPAAQTAPDDARFNNPLDIPLDTTVSVLDFVSYPDGDREDRVRYSVTGMNNNSSASGGRARLVISVSCFGENTDQIQFFTGGQTYTCGQTLVDREVTADSDTGSIVITAVGGSGTYVQWVLTGTATRVN
jgi:hypothetical protein